MTAGASEWLDDHALYHGAEKGKARAARRALVERLVSQGVGREEILTAVRENRLAALSAELVLGHETPYTLTDVARRARLDSRFLRQALLALGRPNPSRGKRVFGEDDVRDALILRRFIEAGLPRREILQVARVFGQSLANIAAAIRELIADSLQAQGDSEHDVALRYAAAAQELGPLLEPLLGHQLRMHIRESVRREAVTEAEPVGAPQGTPIAIGFADLVNFTRLGDSVSPDQLGRIAGRLAQLATARVKPPVRLVKTIGDAVMLASPEVDPLLDVLLALLAAVEKEGDEFPQLRAGVAYGKAVSRGGDWFGAPVNLASRLTTAAKPGTINVSAEAREAADKPYGWTRRRRKALKGLRRVAYFRLTPT